MAWQTVSSFKSNVYDLSKTNNFTIRLSDGQYKNPVFFTYWKSLLYNGYVLGCSFPVTLTATNTYRITPYVKTMPRVTEFIVLQGSFELDTASNPYLRKIGFCGGMYPSESITIQPYYMSVTVRLNNGTVIYSANNINTINGNIMNTWVWEYIIPPQYYGQRLFINMNSSNQNARDAYLMVSYSDKNTSGQQYIAEATESSLTVMVTEAQ